METFRHSNKRSRIFVKVSRSSTSPLAQLNPCVLAISRGSQELLATLRALLSELRGERRATGPCPGRCVGLCVYVCVFVCVCVYVCVCVCESIRLLADMSLSLARQRSFQSATCQQIPSIHLLPVKILM